MINALLLMLNFASITANLIPFGEFYTCPDNTMQSIFKIETALGWDTFHINLAEMGSTMKIFLEQEKEENFQLLLRFMSDEQKIKMHELRQLEVGQGQHRGLLTVYRDAGNVGARVFKGSEEEWDTLTSDENTTLFLQCLQIIFSLSVSILNENFNHELHGQRGGFQNLEDYELAYNSLKDLARSFFIPYFKAIRKGSLMTQEDNTYTAHQMAIISRQRRRAFSELAVAIEKKQLEVGEIDMLDLGKALMALHNDYIAFKATVQNGNH